MIYPLKVPALTHSLTHLLTYLHTHSLTHLLTHLLSLGASAISLKRNLDIDRTVDVSPEGSCEHAVKQEKQLVYQRYCHVYKEGELVALCSSIPGCRLLDSGWDKGNWYVKLLKFHDDRLSAMGPSVPLPAMARNI